MSIACCFIHNDVRNEIHYMFYSLVYKLKCHNRCKCLSHLDEVYMHRLRFRKSFDHKNSVDTTGMPTTTSYSTALSTSERKNSFAIGYPKNTPTDGVSSKSCLFSCLLGNQKNDFFGSTRRKSLYSLTDAYNRKKASITGLFNFQNSRLSKTNRSFSSDVNQETLESFLSPALANPNNTDQNEPNKIIKIVQKNVCFNELRGKSSSSK